MNTPFPLPLRAIGPGSQPSAEPMHVLPMPRDMTAFAMPSVPDAAPDGALAGARDVLATFQARFAEWNVADVDDAPRVDLAALPPSVRNIVDDMLGEGEVAIVVGGARRYRIQESVFTGVWRVCALDGDGLLAAEWLEASPVPRVVLDAAASAGDRITAVELPPGAMNSPALIAELTAQLAARAPGAPAHVVNLTLLPLAPDDHHVLARALPPGAVAMMSRGFGQCRIASTDVRGIWRVQYFNSMATPILDTIEVVDVPDVALAAPEDLADSRDRLAELVDWIDASLSEATRV